MASPGTQSGMPHTGQPLVDSNGIITRPWFRFLQILFSSVPPTGAVVLYAGPTSPPSAIPPGWLLCGQNVSRTQYSALFSKIGVAWGVGDGSTTFGLPPLSSPIPNIIKL